MNREKKKYKIDIFDEEYVLVSDEAESLIMNAAIFVDKTMREIQKSGVRDGKRIAVLTALRFASLLEQHNQQKIVAQEKERELVARIDQELLSSLL
jgi:cell division protein ZapA (FtsZ GTPase activity inhibitor)